MADEKDMLGIERSLAILDKRNIKSMISKRFDTIQSTQSLDYFETSKIPCFGPLSGRNTRDSGAERVQKVDISMDAKSVTNDLKTRIFFFFTLSNSSREKSHDVGKQRP